AHCPVPGDPTRASTSKLLGAHQPAAPRGDYRRQSAETEEAQLNDFLQERAAAATLSTEADRKAKPQQQPQRRRKKVHLGLRCKRRLRSSGGARAAAGSRFFEVQDGGASSSKQQQQPPKPQPSSAPPKRTSSQQQPQQPQAVGARSAQRSCWTRPAASLRSGPQQQQQAAVSTSMSSSLTDPDRPQVRKAACSRRPPKLLRPKTRPRTSCTGTAPAWTSFLSAEQSTASARTRQVPPADHRRHAAEAAAAAAQPKTRRRLTGSEPQPPLTRSRQSSFGFSTEHHVRSFTADSASTTRTRTRRLTAARPTGLVIRHRPPVPPIELSQDSSIGEAVVRKPALKKSSSFSDIQGGDGCRPAGDQPPVRLNRHGTTSRHGVPVRRCVADADDQDNDEEDEDGDGDRFGIVKDVDDIEEDLEYDRPAWPRRSPRRGVGQDFDDFDGGEATDRRAWRGQRGSAAQQPGIRTASPRRATTSTSSSPARRDRRVREEIRTTARDESSRRARSRSSSQRIERRAASAATRVRRPPPAAAAAAAATAVRSRRYRSRERHRRHIRDVEVQTRSRRPDFAPAGGGRPRLPVVTRRPSARRRCSGLGLGASADPTARDRALAVGRVSRCPGGRHRLFASSAALNSLRARPAGPDRRLFGLASGRIYQGAVAGAAGGSPPVGTAPRRRIGHAAIFLPGTAPVLRISQRVQPSAVLAAACLLADEARCLSWHSTVFMRWVLQQHAVHLVAGVGVSRMPSWKVVMEITSLSAHL
uniref:Protein kinase domain-containing protein n=1 Tax=Macrostomum lignano TaxID=282301 RepID=A0A1I8FEP7_9PLAT